jgi:hypothetical protein
LWFPQVLAVASSSFKPRVFRRVGWNRYGTAGLGVLRRSTLPPTPQRDL